MLFASKVVLNSFEAMVLLYIIHHPREVIHVAHCPPHYVYVCWVLKMKVYKI